MRNIHRKCVIHESSPKSGTSWIWPERKWTIFVINISLSLNDLVNRQRKALVFWGCPLCHVIVSTVSSCVRLSTLFSVSVHCVVFRTVHCVKLSGSVWCDRGVESGQTFSQGRGCSYTPVPASAMIIATSLDYKRSKSSDGYTMGQVHLTTSFLMPGVRW